METKRKILFLDDEAFFAKGYRRELEKHFDVVFCEDAADALKLLRQDATIKALVLDVMLPPPQGVGADATAEGLETGIWLLSELGADMLLRLPVVILTNRFRTDIQAGLARRRIPTDGIEIRHKLETPDWYLPQRLRNLIGG